MAVVISDEELLADALRHDTPWYAETFLKIVNKRGDLVPFVLNDAQLQVCEALEEQRQRDVPMRALCLKARQLGVSTLTQGMLIQRSTQLENHRAVTIAHHGGTSGELFEIGERMYMELPNDPLVKPPLSNQRRAQELVFGEPSRDMRRKGHVGLNSRYSVDTAREFQSSRGFTIRSLHVSEVAFFPDAKRKLTGVMQTVPDEPGTLVVIEFTANGWNHAKTLWDDAESGRSDYVPLFFPWWQNPEYERGFATDRQRDDLEAQAGTGALGEDEPALIEVLEEAGFDHEQILRKLHWRRHKIMSPDFAGDIRMFNQEMPASPGEAFLATGSQVFSLHLVAKALEHAKESDPVLATDEQPGPDVGVIEPSRTVTRRSRYGTVDVPLEPRFAPRPRAEEGVWRIWAHPVEGRHYIVAMDPASDLDVTTETDTARHGIEVIDHQTREQVAEYATRGDSDLAGVQAYLAALYYQSAWLAVEVSGGYGLAITKRIFLDFRYPKLYTRPALDRKTERQTDRLGWDTNTVSKVVLVDGAKELLREGTHGIRSRLLADEMKTYVRGPRGRMMPEKGFYADRLMAWMIAQQIATEKPIPRKREGPISTATRRMRYPKAGY